MVSSTIECLEIYPMDSPLNCVLDITADMITIQDSKLHLPNIYLQTQQLEIISSVISADEVMSNGTGTPKSYMNGVPPTFGAGYAGLGACIIQ